MGSFGKYILCSFAVLTAFTANAGIDWSRYDDGPTFFLGWEASFYFAIGAVVLFGISWILTESNKDKNGSVEGGVGCLVGITNVAMIICAICSLYLLIPLFMVYTLIKSKK